MKYTFKDFQRDFPTDDVCLDYIFKQKFTDTDKYYKVKGRKCYASVTGQQIHPLKGTIFEKSSTPLTIWFYAIFQFSTSKNGVSAKKLQRDLGVTYKCAWRIAKKIRELMNEDGLTLSGTVEVDETFIGGRGRQEHKLTDKAAVIGMVERGGHVKATHIEGRQTHLVLNEVKRNIAVGTQLMTDEFKAYKRTPLLGYKHSSIKHGKGHYVEGNVYTNTIEGFWSQLKRSVDGHLPRYFEEAPADLRERVRFPV